MFSGFNLRLDKDFFIYNKKNFQDYKYIGENHLKKETFIYQDKLEKYVENDIINGSWIQDEWFSEIDADIFISHSHKDKDLANALAGWLHETFDLKVFIDSNVWGFSEKLLENINSQYSDKRKNSDGIFLYNHQKCNMASQHVNMMLTVALQKMIDKVECVILLNTDNSIPIFDEYKKKINSTYSPWIYCEIISSQIVRKKPLFLYRSYDFLKHTNESTDFVLSYNMLKVSYNISLNHLTKLGKKELDKWDITYHINDDEYNKYPLDALYSFTHQKELIETKDIFMNYNFNQVENLKKCIAENAQTMYIFPDFAYNNFFEVCIDKSDICKCEKCPFLYVKRRSINE